MKVKFTEKLFYKKYPYKLKFYNRAEKDRYPAQINKKFQEEVQLRFPKNVRSVSDQFKQRREYSWSLFFKNKEDYDFFFNEFNEFIIESCSPDSPESLELMKNNLRIRVRNSLYWGKFEYKIYFKEYYNYDRIKFVTEYLRDYFDNSGNQSKKDYYIYLTSWDTPILYLKNKDDLLIIKMALADYIKEINQVKLIPITEKN